MTAAFGGSGSSLWWAEPLAAFADAFDTDCEVLHESRASIREVGEWWMLAERWHVQLDKFAIAQFAPGEELNAGARRLLTVALLSGQASVVEDTPWREILTRHYSDMVLRASQPGDYRPGDDSRPGDSRPGDYRSGDHRSGDSRPGDFRTDDIRTGDHRLIQRMSSRELPLPGYFASIEFTGVGPDVDDFRALVEDIFAEFEPTEFLGWTAHPHNAQSALIFVSHNIVIQSMDSEEPASSVASSVASSMGSSMASSIPSSMTSCVVPSVVYEFFAMLLGTLESEAMAAAKATVGFAVNDSRGWYDGLASVVQAWREHYWFAPEVSVYIWGQRPVLFLLSSLPTHAIAEFIQMASAYRTEGDADGGSATRSSSGDVARLGTSDILLTAELSETLEGFLMANLNVSEASRILYLHRNTLMNRLDRIRAQTGYDVRHFEDALILWLVQGLLGSMKADGESRGKAR